ncbi:NAD(P)H-binding protein [Amycolatopsis sp. CA-128772]|uniref:NAD(P)H-binding protein n=1 Tax=Amycolatopsis sp. CA-128772 TaxID=2073159 RepID=UPI000CD29EB4|nr:NAD(P)H-binding protein [Amycolatopsis sp. CA-128772]
MIVVTTPAGQVGRRLVRLLLAGGRKVKVVVRDAARLDDDVREQVEVVEGTHDDPATLDAALPGADALFWLVPPNPAAPSAEQHYLNFARAGREAVRRHDVGHVVAVSSAGHGWAKPAGVLSAAFAMDAELERAGAAYRAVSPPFYLENLLGQLPGIRERGAFSLTCAGDQPLATIATRDIAATAAGLLTDLSWTGQAAVPVFGPDRLTPDGMAAVIGEQLGRPVRYHRISLAEFAAMRRSQGAGERMVADAVEMFAAQDEGVYDADWAKATITATDFRTWCREVFAPAF